jgi:hypothetical protein
MDSPRTFSPVAGVGAQGYRDRNRRTLTRPCLVAAVVKEPSRVRRDPIQYATYFDRHYLTRGLALYRSLVRHSPPFVLWVLCLDEQTHRTLSNLRIEQVELVRLAELEQADHALLAAKPGRQAVEYYWTCGPAFLVYLLEQHPIDMLTYLDADLFFFGDPTPIYDELGDGSILLVEHRRSSSVPELINQKGTYNVGLLVFRRTSEAAACLRRWRTQCLDWCFDRVEPTRFGDQKYLDDWPSRYRGLVVAQHKGAGLAPWNLENYRFSYAQGRVWVDTNPLLYYHFTRLRVINRWLYDPALWELGQHRPDPNVKRHIYVPYVRELGTAGKLLRAVGGKVHPDDTVRWSRNKLLLLTRMVRHRSFLVMTDVGVP